MLAEVRIANLGVIEQTQLELGPGFIVLTGETGAGKTMVLTAVQLLLGQRAQPQLVRSGATAATVDGVWELALDTAPQQEVFAYVTQLGAELEEGQLYLSRRVPAADSRQRSRSSIGGRPVPASALAQVSEPLLTIHGQHDQQRLRSPAAQRELLDSFGGAAQQQLLETYRQEYAHWQELQQELAQWEVHAAQRAEELAELTAQLREYEELAPEADEDDTLPAEIARLSHAQELSELVGQVLVRLRGGSLAGGALGGALGGADYVAAESELLGAVATVQAGVHELAQAQQLDASVLPHHDTLVGLAIGLDELAHDLSAYAQQLTGDPTTLAQKQDRLAQLRAFLLGKAHSCRELSQWQSETAARVAELVAVQDPQALQEQVAQREHRVRDLAQALTKTRTRLAQDLSQKVGHELAALAMASARVQIQVQVGSELGPTGQDEVVFLLQPYPDATALPLAQAASGGELSRVMLALEVSLAADQLPDTMIFDEIDAGIGGSTGLEVGRRLAELAQHTQVIVVTHLAQVAAFAHTHLVVQKAAASGQTTVTEVSGESRHQELARMLGGISESASASQHAQELIALATESSPSE